MENTRNSKNCSSRKAIVKANLKTNLKKPHLVAQQNQLHQQNTFLWQQSSLQTNPRLKKKTNVDSLTSPMFLDPLQTSNNNHSNPTPNINSPLITPTPSLSKRSSSCVYPFATHVDVNSLAGYKKQKDLKSTISAPVQSYLHVSIDQTKGDKTY